MVDPAIFDGLRFVGIAGLRDVYRGADAQHEPRALTLCLFDQVAGAPWGEVKDSLPVAAADSKDAGAGD